MAKSVDEFIIDFAKEETSGGGAARFNYKPGTFPVKIKAAKPITSTDKGTPGLEVHFVFTDGKYKGKPMTDTLWASPKAYRRFRRLLEACGLKVPEKVNLAKIAKAIKGRELAIELDFEEPREGREQFKPRIRVTFEGFIHLNDFEEDEVEDDEDTDDDEVEDDEDDEVEESDDEEEEEEEEPEPAVATKNGRKKAPAKKPAKAAAKVEEDEDDDLEDLDLDEF
jgi:hypothetical protein